MVARHVVPERVAVLREQQRGITLRRVNLFYAQALALAGFQPCGKCGTLVLVLQG